MNTAILNLKNYFFDHQGGCNQNKIPSNHLLTRLRSTVPSLSHDKCFWLLRQRLGQFELVSLDLNYDVRSSVLRLLYHTLSGAMQNVSARQQT